ncbi:MAG: RsmD family RNA methyltransferase [Prevotella sp.]|nr:RsmD family RNA methyltransferase [Prevotella sp.]
MNQATADFITEHLNDDIRQLALRGTKDAEVDMTYALDQIAGWQTARHKLPSWAAVEGIVYPPHLSMEQCSSEQTALYKGLLAGQPATVVDLTGGFGVDFSFLARGTRKAVYVEQQPHLCDMARHNFRLLGLHHAEVVCADAADYLRQMAPVDLIYIDPARRDSHGGRTYGIADCSPDVLSLRQLLLQKARRVLIKLSPMLDWRKAVSDLGRQYVSEVHIVSADNECKELLVVMAEKTDGLRLVCVNDEDVFEATPSATPYSPSPCMPLPSAFLYEPNASIMKAGCFNALAQHYGVAPIARDSHLFVSADPVDQFPGRTFQIDAVTSLRGRDLKTCLGATKQANITVRNFPLSVAELRRRLKLSEGGSVYIFATTLADNKHVLLITHKPYTEPQSQ